MTHAGQLRVCFTAGRDRKISRATRSDRSCGMHAHRAQSLSENRKRFKTEPARMAFSCPAEARAGMRVPVIVSCPGASASLLLFKARLTLLMREAWKARRTYIKVKTGKHLAAMDVFLCVIMMNQTTTWTQPLSAFSDFP